MYRMLSSVLHLWSQKGDFFSRYTAYYHRVGENNTITDVTCMYVMAGDNTLQVSDMLLTADDLAVAIASSVSFFTIVVTT